jgi:hypothetical protein
MNLYLGLVHYPIRSKDNKVITTSVTNLDIHDISRSSKTYGVKEFHLITPLKIQQEMVQKIIGHWGEDVASDYNPDRVEALSVARVSDSINSSIARIQEKEGHRPLVVVTGAGFNEGIDAGRLKITCEEAQKSCLLLFGTGWGMDESAIKMADFCLKKIAGNEKNQYNHLSVRAAVAIYLDRIIS